MPFKQTQFESSHMGIGTVLKRHRLGVPANQREYSWEDEVSTLLEDFSEAIHRNASYIIGTIVLTRPENGDAPEIADGQQRLATTTILLAAIRDYFCTHDEEILAGSVEHDFLFTVVRETKEKVPRLLLNVLDRDYFLKRVLARPDSDERKNAEPPSKASHKRINEAAELAAAKVGELVAGQKPQVAVERLNEWIEFIEHGVQVILVVAPDDLSAFKMFETLNDRGMEMSQVDLLKNHLFELAGTRLDEVQQKWLLAMGTLETVDVPVLRYLKYLLVMLYGWTPEKELMQRIKDKIKTRQRALEFVDSFQDGATIFVAIFSPDHPRWNPYGTTAKRHLATILNDLRVEQVMPLTMAIASRFSVREAQKAFRLLVCWSVRFLISGGRGGFLDKHYSAKAFAVGSGEITTASGLADAMINEGIAPPDGAFRAKFASATVSKAHLSRYYLRALELQAKGDREPELIPNPSGEIINLEHVLPQNPSVDWGVDDETAVGYYRRLGNQVLLQASVNSSVGNAPFSEKRQYYRDSAFFLTAMAGKRKQWGIDEIVKRQEYLAELAVKTWPLR